MDAFDRSELTRLVRRIMLRKILDGEDYEPADVPESLQTLTCRASVTLRQRGRLLATADSDSLPVMTAVTRAARSALSIAGAKTPLAELDPDTLGLEIELCSELEMIGHGGEPPERLCARLEPAIHGFDFRVDGRDVLVKPSQLISTEIFCDDDGELDHHCNRYQVAVQNLQDRLGLTKSPPARSPENVLVYRFRTTHWYQRSNDAEPIQLVAGMRVVEPAEALPEKLPAAIKNLGDYLLHRQNPDGLFSYEFLPGRDIYWTDENWVRQAGTAWALACYARWRGEPELSVSAERAIQKLKKLIRPMAGNPRASYLHTPDRLYALGSVALLSLALMDSPHADKEADVLAALINGMESLQQSDGHFLTHFPPSQKTSSQDYYPGEALLAIARYYRLHPDADRRAACDRALPVYMAYFRETQVPPFIPWQVQAWGELARTTHLQKYADFVYEMTDYLLTLQLHSDQLPLSLYDGAIDTTGEGRGGVSTAVYLEGLVDAIRTAEVFGDTQRAARYRAAAQRMTRFALQMCFRPEEDFYVQSPREVIGGVRNTPGDPTLRIDHVQHTLAALMGVTQVLTPASQPAAR